MAGSLADEAEMVLGMLGKLCASSEAGIDFIYATLDHVAGLYDLSDAQVVTVDDLLGVQIFTQGRRSIDRDRAVELMSMEPGLYTVPGVVPQVVSGGVASLCQLALTLELAHRSATHDSLTGLANRRAFDTALATAAARSSRHGWGFTVVVMDLDGFTEVNDTFGHVVGDQTLRSFGQALAKAVRTGDVAARVGGDEFGAILSNAGPEASDVLIRRIWQELPANYPVRGVSSGSASAPEETVHPKELFRLADVRVCNQKGGIR